VKFIGIIPARFASERFPGKPIADLAGKPLIQWVYERAASTLDDLIVATDDRRINYVVSEFGGNVVMTSTEHKSGTDRCAEAARIISKQKGNIDVVINIQGDEPFMQDEQLEQLMKSFEDESVHISTLATPVTEKEEIFDPNVVKVVTDNAGNALYFSRSPIPFLRNVDQDQWQRNFAFLRHLGIYAYRHSTLQVITELESSPLEIAESLEQNRWLQNGFSIHVEITQTGSIGIDTPEDLEKAKKIILDRKS